MTEKKISTKLNTPQLLPISLKKVPGYKQSTTLKDGLIQMWEWAKTQPKREQFKWDNYEIEKGIYTYWK